MSIIEQEFYHVLKRTKQQQQKIYGPFLWMGFNCLKATVTSRRSNICYERYFYGTIICFNLISASVCTANQLTGFYIRATLALNGLINPA